MKKIITSFILFLSLIFFALWWFHGRKVPVVIDKTDAKLDPHHVDLLISMPKQNRCLTVPEGALQEFNGVEWKPVLSICVETHEGVK